MCTACVNKLSLAKKKMCIYTERERERFIMGIGSCGYRGPEAPGSAVHELENQESGLYNSVQVPRPENGEDIGCKTCSESESSGTSSDNVQGQEEKDFPAQAERTNFPFLCVFALRGPSADWVMPTHTGCLLYPVY